MLLARLGVLGLLGVGACTIPNETHCGNQQGDATCSERFGAPMYCDVCVAANDGCVDAMPDAACRFGESGPAGSTSTASSGTPIDPTTTSASESGTTMPLSASGSEVSSVSTADATSTTDVPDESTGVDTTDASSSEATEGSETAATTEPSMSTGTQECTPFLQPCENDEECCGDLVCGVAMTCNAV